MATIQKKWGEVVRSYNFAAQIAQNAKQQLESIKRLEKADKSKEEIKEQIEQNTKNKPLYIELDRVYTKLIEHLQDLVEIHQEKINDILIDHALETEVSPAKDNKPAVMKLVLDEKGEYCFDRAGEKAKAKAIRSLNEDNVMVPQLEIATTLTEKPEVFEGILIFQKLVEKPRGPLKPVPKKK